MAQGQRELPPEVIPIVPVLQRTEVAAQTAIDGATRSVDALTHDIGRKKLDLTAIEFARSSDPRIKAFGQAARDFLKKGQTENAELALGMAEALTRVRELGKKYESQEWVQSFISFADTLKAKIDELDDQTRATVYLYISVTKENVQNGGRVETIERFRSSKDSFIQSAVPKIEELYLAGQTELADRTLGALSFYNQLLEKTRKGEIKPSDGQAEVKAAIEGMLSGNANAEEMLKRSLQKYTIALTCNTLSAQVDSFQAQYKDMQIGKNEELERMLADARKYLQVRQPDQAQKLMEAFIAKANEFAKKKQGEQLDQVGENIAATQEALEKIKEQLRSYVGLFGTETKKLLDRLEDLSANGAQILALTKKAKEGTATEEEMKTLQRMLDEFAKEQKNIFALVPTAIVVMNAIIQEQQFEQALKMSNVHAQLKNRSLDYGDDATEALRECLGLLLEGGANSVAAREKFAEAAERKMRAVATLRLKDHVPIVSSFFISPETIAAAIDKRDHGREEFGFFEKAQLRLYDLCTQGNGFEADTWKLSQALFNLESVVRKSDDKLFTTREMQLQTAAVDASKALIAHYAGAQKLDEPRIKGMEAIVRTNSDELARKITNADRINTVVEFGASLVHPAILATVVIKGVAKEYEITDTISWTSGLMLAASVIAFRHAGLASGAFAGVGRTAAGRAITAVELGIGGTLAIHGAIGAYHQFKQGNYIDGALSAAMLALPLIYATVRTPAIRAAKRAYRKTGELILERIPARLAELKARLPEFKVEVLRFARDERGSLTLRPAKPIVSPQLERSISLHDIIRRNPEKIKDLKPAELARAAYELEGTNPEAARFLQDMATKRYEQMLIESGIDPKAAPKLPTYKEAAKIVSEYGQTLKTVDSQLHGMFGENAVLIGTRPKNAESFINKLAEKRAKGKIDYVMPEDMVGGRAVFESMADARKARDMIERNPEFEILSKEIYADIPGGKDGYRAYHFIVRLKSTGQKAEIQVATVRQRVWADWTHDTIYKKSAVTKDGRAIPNEAYAQGREYALQMSEWLHKQDLGVEAGPKPQCPQLVKEFFGEMDLHAWIEKKLSKSETIPATLVERMTPPAVQSALYGEGLGAIRKGNQVVVFDGNYLLGKHGGAGSAAGSKLGDVASVDQLAALIQKHVDPASLTSDRVVIPNVSVGTRTGTDSLVTILAIREGTSEVSVGSPLQKGVEYKVKVRDQSGAEFDATMKFEVTRPASPDGRFPEIVQSVVYSDRAPPATDKVNVVLMKIDPKDARAEWINRDALEKQTGSIEGSDVYAVLTAFPGEYAPDAGARRAAFDPIVGMSGEQFWSSHALMKKPQ